MLLILNTHIYLLHVNVMYKCPISGIKKKTILYIPH